MRYREFIKENEESDEELFGTSLLGAQRAIYVYGKQMLQKLEHAYRTDPELKQIYHDYTHDQDTGEHVEPDNNALFELVCDVTGAKFGKAFIVDNIIREYGGGMEGLNDFGWMIEQGEWESFVQAWDTFGHDNTVTREDWFQKEVQDFMGDR